MKKYTLGNIKIGFEKFFSQFGHYPTASEVDSCEYLPSARQIQRRFGGLPTLRKNLGILDTHLGAGKFRLEIARNSNCTGFNAERKLEKILINYFGKPFVHIEKPIDCESRSRFDFYVFAEDLEFGIDIFCSDTKHNISVNVNKKIDSYKNVKVPMFLILENIGIPQSFLDDIVKSKPNKPLNQNMRLLTLNSFLTEIKEIKPLEIRD